jgi:hypothetical protein
MDDDDIEILNRHALKFEKNLERREVVSILVQAGVLNDGDQIDIRVCVYTFKIFTIVILRSDSRTNGTETTHCWQY